MQQKIFYKIFFRKTSPSDVTCHRTMMYNVHVVVPTCVFWWCAGGVSKNPILGGGVKNGRFWGGSQKGPFLTPPGAQNFLHPPPGKPRQNIYYLDTRHPPGGVGLGGGFRTPPWTVVARGVFGAIFAPPRPR